MTSTNDFSSQSNPQPDGEDGGEYEIKIQDLLDNHWGRWFEGMRLERVMDRDPSKSYTLIRGTLADQAALHSLLAKIRDLNLTLISVDRTQSQGSEGIPAAAGMEGDLLAGYCGLYCGACYHYLSSFPGNEHLFEMHNSGRCQNDFTCRGCRSEKLYVHPGCKECEMRSCAQSQGLLHCGACKEFPCDQLLNFQNDGRIHHHPILIELRHIQAIGLEEWIQHQRVHWTCECGAPYSWYEETCVRCGRQLADRNP